MAEALRQQPLAPTAVPPAGAPQQSSLVTVVSGAILVGALYLGREVFIPIVLAVLLSFVIGPLVTLLRRIGLPRVPATITSVLVAVGIIVGLAGIIGTQVADLASDLPRYRATISQKVSAVQSAVSGRLSRLLRDISHEVANATQGQPGSPTAQGSTSSPPAKEPMPVEIRQRDPNPIQLLRDYVGTVLHPVATTGIVLIVVVFILLQREDLRDRMIRLFGSTDLHRTTAAMDDAAARLSRYFLMQLALNASFGVIIAIGLYLIGVPNPILWGMVAALMRFVPYIGAFIAGFLPVLLAAAVDPGWTMVFLTVGLFLITEPIMGHVVEPLAYGRSTGLSPFAVVVSAIFWTWLWGPIGLILATPLTLCFVVLGRHVERLEFLDVLLGDRPALTPVENFYQRVLAGDPDEAQEHAEELLKTSALSAYYDDVALKGLQLAANDAMRGVLTDEQIARIRDSIRSLVDDLADYEDVKPPDAEEQDEDKSPPTEIEGAAARSGKGVAKAPPPANGGPAGVPEEWRAPRSILCIAGRGRLDEAAAAMLAQLLQKKGFGAELVPHAAVARSAILGLDPEGVRMVCMSYLDISGNPAHLRYLLRRLRQKLPNVPILVGLWPAEDPVLTDQKLGKTVGADHYVSSLRAAVEACVARATAKEEEPGTEKRPAAGPAPAQAAPSRPQEAAAAPA